MKHIKKIGVFSPSSYVEERDIDAAKAFIEERGFETFIHPQTFAKQNQSAGTVDEKLEALHSLYIDDTIDVIWATGGGNRALQIIDGIDYDLIKNNQKPLIGFSDVTALLNAITVKTGIPNIHGPVFKNLPRHQEIKTLLSGDFSMKFDSAQVIQPGSAEGKLFGGNLSVFQYLPETLAGDWLNGTILFLEDCNEEISRIDRMFIHLKRLGVFEQINGLILGSFSNLQDGTRPFGFSLEDIVREHTNGSNVSIIMDAPFGHGEHLHPILIGKDALLDSKNMSLIYKNTS